jgi:glycine dehydrogenase
VETQDHFQNQESKSPASVGATSHTGANTSQMNLEPIMTEDFTRRHIGPETEEVHEMLSTLGVDSLDQVIDKAAPQSILQKSPLEIGRSLSESAILKRARELADKNKVFHSFLGQGYYGTHTPGVILRNILENPGWYTAYTPYQAEISQGRMEALLNFQSLVVDSHWASRLPMRVFLMRELLLLRR